MRKLYLAYGSNILRARMKQRAPNCRLEGTIIVRDARLVFRGVADLIYSPGDTAPAALWSINRSDENNLDQAEAVGRVYDKQELKLDSGDAALIYVMRSNGIYPPTQYYYDTIAKGYREQGFAMAPLEEALRHALENKKPDEQTTTRRARQKSEGWIDKRTLAKRTA